MTTSFSALFLDSRREGFQSGTEAVFRLGQRRRSLVQPKPKPPNILLVIQTKKQLMVNTTELLSKTWHSMIHLPLRPVYDDDSLAKVRPSSPKGNAAPISCLIASFQRL